MPNNSCSWHPTLQSFAARWNSKMFVRWSMVAMMDCIVPVGLGKLRQHRRPEIAVQHRSVNNIDESNELAVVAHGATPLARIISLPTAMEDTTPVGSTRR